MSDASTQLKQAWERMLEGLERARAGLESPDLFAPPVTELGLAEGYRYLLGYTFGAIERAVMEDPRFPYFRRAIQPMDKATIDNADALYLSAAIDGTQSYRVTGHVADHRHWNGGPRGAGPQAPSYVIFENHSSYAGDSGELAELGPGGRVVTAVLDISGLQVDEDGTFEILLAPVRPAEHTGNFMATTKQTDDETATAAYLIVRVLYGDWDNEVAPDLDIGYLGEHGTRPAAITPDQAAATMQRVGDLVANQVAFWNIFYDQILETHGDRNGDGLSFMPRNGLNEPAGANLATGGGQVTNYYSGGVFDLSEDQALLIEVTVPVTPTYAGTHLANFWGESLDYANRASSLSHLQAVPDEDGVTRYVVAGRDPGVHNWLDTAGHNEGFMTFRWTYLSPPAELPAVEVSLLPLTALEGRLPVGTRRVAPAEREAQIRARQAHVRRRFRQY
jgi:hypothetical protein